MTTNINELQLKYKFERNEINNKIKIIPLTTHSFQCQPLDKPYIEVTNDEFIGLVTRKKQFSNSLNNPQVIDFIRTTE